MKALHLTVLTLISLLIIGCSGAFNPTGPPPRNDAHHISTEPIVVKGITVPVGTKIVYGDSYRKGRSSRLLSEDKITAMEFPAGKPLQWAGVPVVAIRKFYNRSMRGYTLQADFDQLKPGKMTKFAQLWKSSGSDDLGVDVNNIADWSFKRSNIADVRSCGVNNQRYFKDDKKQQRFLDSLYAALMKN